MKADKKTFGVQRKITWRFQSLKQIYCRHFSFAQRSFLLLESCFGSWCYKLCSSMACYWAHWFLDSVDTSQLCKEKKKNTLETWNTHTDKTSCLFWDSKGVSSWCSWMCKLLLPHTQFGLAMLRCLWDHFFIICAFTDTHVTRFLQSGYSAATWNVVNDVPATCLPSMNIFECKALMLLVVKNTAFSTVTSHKVQLKCIAISG